MEEEFQMQVVLDGTKGWKSEKSDQKLFSLFFGFAKQKRPSKLAAD